MKELRHNTVLRLRRELRKARAEARTDVDTGLGNKRRWRETVGELVDAGTPFVAVVFDMANLKAVNSVLGHYGADRVIADIARHIRHGDALGCRIGGDEFAVLLPGATLEEAAAVRDRIEREVGIRNIGRGLCTFLVGAVARWVPGGPSVEGALRFADIALERRKQERKAQLGQPLTRNEATRFVA